MSLTSLLNRDVLIIRRDESGSTDELGNDVPTETAVLTVGEFQQRQRDEHDEGDISDTHWMLFLPAGTIIDSGDVVEIDGKRYEVVGEPWSARNPRTQAESHVECTLRRTAGSERAS